MRRKITNADNVALPSMSSTPPPINQTAAQNPIPFILTQSFSSVLSSH